jgi:hypothetical protein
MVGISSQIASWVATEAQAQGMSVMAADDVAKSLGEAVYASVQNCRGDTDCIQALRLPLHTQRLVVGTLDRDAQSYLVHLWLFEVPSLKPLGQLERAVRIATRHLGPELRQALPPFLRGEPPRTGILELRATSEGASVQVDGASQGTTPLRLSLSPGRHELELQKPGFLPARRWVTVTSGGVTRTEVPLLRIPGTEEGQAPFSASLALPPPAMPTVEGHVGFRLSTGTYVAAGIGVAAAATGIGLGVASNNIEQRLQSGYDPVTQIYTGTRAQALAARKEALAADILFAAAGAAALTALGIALFSPAPEAPRASLMAGPHGAGIALGGHF